MTTPPIETRAKAAEELFALAALIQRDAQALIRVGRKLLKVKTANHAIGALKRYVDSSQNGSYDNARMAQARAGEILANLEGRDHEEAESSRRERVRQLAAAKAERQRTREAAMSVIEARQVLFEAGEITSAFGPIVPVEKPQPQAPACLLEATRTVATPKLRDQGKVVPFPSGRPHAH